METGDDGVQGNPTSYRAGNNSMDRSFYRLLKMAPFLAFWDLQTSLRVPREPIIKVILFL
jgi:hypothetical protein